MSTSPDTRDRHGLRNKLHSRATEAIFSGAQWLTSQQVSSLVYPDTDGRHREVARWRGRTAPLRAGSRLHAAAGGQRGVDHTQSAEFDERCLVV